MRPIEEIVAELARDAAELKPEARVHHLVGNVTAQELLAVCLALTAARSEAASLSERLRSACEERENAEIARLREAIQLAEATRDAAQDIATRETLRRREVEAELEKKLLQIEAARAELGAFKAETVTHAAFRCTNRIADLRHALDGDDDAARRAMREQLVDVVENERVKRHTVLDGDAYARGKADGYRWCAEEILRRLREISGAGASADAPDHGGGVMVETSTGTLVVRAGDVLEGTEGDVTTRILVTYVSEETVLARHLWSRRPNGRELAHPDGESMWDLEQRDWRKVDERKLHHDEKPQ